MKWYSIGEFAAKAGVTPDFLKYYEKQGILRPSITENGYRYYSAVQLSVVNECIKLRNMDFSAKETALLLNSTDYQHTMELFSSRQQQLAHKVEYMMSMHRYIEEQHLELPAYKSKNNWNINWRPAFYYLVQSRNFSFDSIGKNEELLKEWQKWQPIVRAAARVDSRTGTAALVEWGLYVPADFAESLGLKVTPPVEHIPPCRCLEYFDRRLLPDDQNNDDHEEVRSIMFHNVQEVLDAHRFTVTGPSYFIVSTKIRENGLRYTYQKIQVPIE